MKLAKLLLFGLILVIMIVVQSVAQEKHDQAENPVSLESYQKQKKNGQTVTLASLFVGVGGGLIMSQSYWNYGPPSPSGPYVIGEFMVISGVIGTVAGITIWSKGEKGIKKYHEQVSVRPSNQNKVAGISLTFRF